MSGLIFGQTAAGKMVPLQVNDAGQLVVSGAVGGGGGGGTSDTLEATQQLVKVAVQNIDVDLGAAGDAAAASDTGASSVVSLIKRGLQRWTTLLDRLPASLGGKTSAASLPVVIASDQAAVPVNASARNCVGAQTINLAAGVVATLNVAAGAVAAQIQADGNTVRITQDGSAPSATVGTRIDDGVIYYVDTSLAAVKLFASVACSARVVYFDKA